ncbi:MULTISPECIES: TrkH family potassium uptake protein [Paenibacillus]|uniref:TrkH family potassium uptake protein n=1 Tax=Paenibacillus TaxID=44249 RepID=UPI0022B9019A|nr:TrkH family potassium uptake protein [Paenibacillus caseinilyticus]MCZ8522826.1 TrkH family potassium uptake protein [Paenibacillus caseinilyticus]
MVGNHRWITPPRILAAGFAFIIGIGTLLLALPAASASGRPIAVMDALFTAVSATCVTGLVVMDTGTSFSLFGQIVILVMVQLGGIGFMTTATWIALALRRRISLRDRLVLKESLNQNTVEGIVRLIIKVFIYAVTVESAASVVFALQWSAEMPWKQALYYGLFHSVSLFNNAGFEIIGGFAPYVQHVGINLVSMFLIVAGGLGFIVMSDVVDYPRTRKLSLHSKVVLAMSGILTVISTVIFLVFEYGNARTLGGMDWDAKLLVSVFHAISLRSGGINTVDIAGLGPATQFMMVIMMFIGAAPGSTGGGLKITTFAVLAGAVRAAMAGKEDVVLFRNRIPKQDIQKAVTLTVIAVGTIVLATMLLLTVQDEDFMTVLFETTSAFGTVGLSMGLTPNLTPAGQVIIMLLMFTGRVGLVTLAFAIQSRPGKELYRYPEGKITIG